MSASTLELTPKYSATFVRAPEAIKLWCEIEGSYEEPLAYEWSTGATSATNELAEVGLYTNPSVTVTDAKGRSATKTFEGAFYVHVNGAINAYVDWESGDDSAAGTEAAPWKTLTNALENVMIAGGDEIIMKRGIHQIQYPVMVRKAVTIRGEGDNWETVLDANNGVIDNPKKPIYHPFEVKMNGAMVCNLTFTRFGADGQSEVVRLNADAVISNCVFTGCFKDGMTAGGRVVSLTAGLLTGCFITNNIAFENAGVYVPQMCVAPVMIENCLVAYNVTSGYNENGSVFDTRCYTHTVKVRNCTIVSNSFSKSTTAVYPWTSQHFANNIIWGNVSQTNETIDCNWKVRADQSGDWVANCTTRAELLLGAGNIGKDPLFASGNPLELRVVSPCRNAGDNTLGSAASVDILGNPRVKSRSIDIGCVECQNGFGLGILVR